MSKKLQCENCHRAEYVEELYEYDGEVLCRPCIVARVCETSIPCEYVGTCNDRKYESKDHQLKEKDKQIKLLKGTLESKETTLNYYRDMYKLRYEEIAKQVCKEIRNQANKHAAYDKNGKWLAFCVLQGILDKTEKGESL